MSDSPSLTAVYPGTFDPMTLGHADLMRRASQLWDRLILAVAAGHHKKTMFSLEERLDMARELARDYPNVEVIAFSGLLRDFVVAHGGKVVVRGLLQFLVVASLPVLANVGVASAFFSLVAEDTFWAQLAGIVVVFVWNYAATSRFVWNSP